MSLINQMLKDLDARRESDARGRLHREVRPLPAVPARLSWRIGGLLVLAVAALGAGVWYFYNSPLWVPPPPAVEPAAAPSPAPVSATPAIEPPHPSTDNADAVPGMPLLESTDGMKMSFALDKPPVAPTPTPRAAKQPVERREPSPVANNARPHGEMAPLPSTASGLIEKQPSAAREGREMSEQEYRRAANLVNGGRVEEAVDLLLDVLRRDGGHIASRQLIARLLIEQRRIDEAYAILAEGLALNPAQTGWAMMLARLQVEQGDLAAAARTLQSSQPHALGNADYLGFAGHIQHRLGHQRAAAELYLRAARVAPDDGRWWFGLGLALEADQRPDEARDAFLRARASASLPTALQTIVEQKLR